MKEAYSAFVEHLLAGYTDETASCLKTVSAFGM
jgi:hypothetical protein